MFEQVANHGLLTAETGNYVVFHRDGETSIICSVVQLTLSSKYHILLFFLLFFPCKDFFQLLGYNVIISVGCFGDSVPKLELKCLLETPIYSYCPVQQGHIYIQS